MNTVQLDSVDSVSGSVRGAAANPDRTCPVQFKKVNSYTAAGSGSTLVSQMLDKATETYTIAANTTVDYDLTSGQIDPLGDACLFTKVRELYIEHVAGSASVTGIRWGTSVTNGFTGPVVAAALPTFLASESMHLKSPTTAGWTVDGTHKVIRIINLDVTNAATVRLFAVGS